MLAFAPRAPRRHALCAPEPYAPRARRRRAAPPRAQSAAAAGDARATGLAASGRRREEGRHTTAAAALSLAARLSRSASPRRRGGPCCLCPRARERERDRHAQKERCRSTQHEKKPTRAPRPPIARPKPEQKPKHKQALLPARRPAGLVGLRRPAPPAPRAAAVDVASFPSTSTSDAANAAAAPYARDTVGQLSAAERQALAERWGYEKIGAELPKGVTLSQVVRSMPQEVFDVNPWRAWGGVLLSLTSMAAALYAISVAPWYLLPLAWFVAGTAFTGFFVIGHDAGHRSFSSNKLVEDIVGTLMFAPLVYPFEPWRIKHNQHHAQTNKLVEDTAWHPIMPEEVEKWSPVQRFCYKAFLGTPLKLWASVGHWAVWHFDLNKYTEKQRPRVLVSLAACALFCATAFPALFAYGGVTAWAKFWLMPWLGYHFWMSTFTLVHHTAPHIPFKPAEQWDAAKAQLSGTVDCDFPKWVEVLTHDISVHVPHHVSSKIPWYNLRKANASLWANWGDHMTKAVANPRLFKTVCAELHVHEKDTGLYRAFDHGKPELMFEVQRKLVPNVV